MRALEQENDIRTLLNDTDWYIRVPGHCFGDGRQRHGMVMLLNRVAWPWDAAMLGSLWLEVQARLVVATPRKSRPRLFTARLVRGGNGRVAVPGSEEKEKEC